MRISYKISNLNFHASTYQINKQLEQERKGKSMQHLTGTNRPSNPCLPPPVAQKNWVAGGHFAHTQHIPILILLLYFSLSSIYNLRWHTDLEECLTERSQLFPCLVDNSDLSSRVIKVHLKLLSIKGSHVMKPLAAMYNHSAQSNHSPCIQYRVTSKLIWNPLLKL